MYEFYSETKVGLRATSRARCSGRRSTTTSAPPTEDALSQRGSQGVLAAPCGLGLIVQVAMPGSPEPIAAVVAATSRRPPTASQITAEQREALRHVNRGRARACACSWDWAKIFSIVAIVLFFVIRDVLRRGVQDPERQHGADAARRRLPARQQAGVRRRGAVHEHAPPGDCARPAARRRDRLRVAEGPDARTS